MNIGDRVKYSAEALEQQFSLKLREKLAKKRGTIVRVSTYSYPHCVRVQWDGTSRASVVTIARSLVEVTNEL